jgi:hypothetical protein
MNELNVWQEEEVKKLLERRESGLHISSIFHPIQGELPLPSHPSCLPVFFVESLLWSRIPVSGSGVPLI